MDDQHLLEIAALIQNELANQGYCYTHKSRTGEEVTHPVVIADVRRDALGRFAAFVVDTRRLPRGVTVPDLHTDKLVKHLQAVVGHPLAVKNSVGLEYVVALGELPAPKRLPNRVDLPSETPDGYVYAWPVGSNGEKEFWVDLVECKHMLVAGMTGAGKTTWIHAGLAALLRRHGPESLQLLLADPKRVELGRYAGLPHLAQPVARDAESAAGLVTWLARELQRRIVAFEEVGARDLRGYNRRVSEPMPLLLVVFDELVDLVYQWAGRSKGEVFGELVRITCTARAFGIVLLFGAQYPRSDVLDTIARNNCGVRVCFKVESGDQSRTVLGTGGAAELLPAGRPGRVRVAGLANGLVTLQGFYVSEQALEKQLEGLQVVDPLALAEGEVVLARYAVEQLGGAFIVDRLYEACRSAGWPRDRIKTLARLWEARGWLTPQVDRVTPRKVTPVLLERLSRSGVG